MNEFLSQREKKPRGNNINSI